MIYFTADQHFNHKNIIKYCDRPFKDVDHMNEEIVRRHNNVVSSTDVVYSLGDFTLGGYETFVEYASRLNGLLRIVPGGHDRWMKDMARSYQQQGALLRRAYVEVVPPLYTLKLGGEYKRDGQKLIIVLCHYAMRVWDRSHHGSYHLFGHSHGNLLSPALKSMDVGVDSHNFYPISLDQVISTLGD